MELLIWIFLAWIVLGFLTRIEQKQRIAILAHLLQPYQIERLMERLLQGYLRALDETDVQRQQQVWAFLTDTEQDLSRQFSQLAQDARQLSDTQAQISRLPVALPWVLKLLPPLAFDLRMAFAIHAQGLARVIANPNQHNRKDQAWTLSAELLLMQHTCHWYCKSKTVASARLLARHQTSYEQVLAAVSPETRVAYGRLVGGAASVA
jgi:hypothetical protein